MAHVKRVERSDCGRCGMLIKVARCRYAMLTLYQVRARNDLKHHHERGKNESGDIKNAKNGGRMESYTMELEEHHRWKDMI